LVLLLVFLIEIENKNIYFSSIFAFFFASSLPFLEKQKLQKHLLSSLPFLFSCLVFLVHSCLLLPFLLSEVLLFVKFSFVSFSMRFLK
jgi:hypothetical protein